MLTTRIVCLTGEVSAVDGLVADLAQPRQGVVVETIGAVSFPDSPARYLMLDKLRRVFTAKPREGSQKSFSFELLSNVAPTSKGK